MTSELRVDNLKGSATGGSINVLGEGTSATTNLQQGLAKVWIRASDAAVDADSLNVSSTTDNDTGDYSYDFDSSSAGITPGNYLIRLQVDKKIYVKRIVKL